MKVKIGDTVYDSSIEPILLILTPKERLDIISMPSNVDKYVSSPEGTDPRMITQWIMEIPRLTVDLQAGGEG